jgi:hypothetical protein
MDSLFQQQGKFNVFKESKMLRKSNFHLNVLQSAFQFRLRISKKFLLVFSTGSHCSADINDNRQWQSLLVKGGFLRDEKAIQISFCRKFPRDFLFSSRFPSGFVVKSKFSAG